MKFIGTKQTSKKFPIQEEDQEDSVSINGLRKDGFRLEVCVCMHDGNGVAFFLTEKDGKKSWWPMRYD